MADADKADPAWKKKNSTRCLQDLSRDEIDQVKAAIKATGEHANRSRANIRKENQKKVILPRSCCNINC